MVVQDELCFNVQWGGRGLGSGEELKGTNIVVSSDAMAGKKKSERVRWDYLVVEKVRSALEFEVLVSVSLSIPASEGTY